MGPKSFVPLAITAYQVSLDGESVISPSYLTTSVFVTGIVLRVAPLAMTSIMGSHHSFDIGKNQDIIKENTTGNQAIL